MSQYIIALKQIQKEEWLEIRIADFKRSFFERFGECKIGLVYSGFCLFGDTRALEYGQLRPTKLQPFQAIKILRHRSAEDNLPYS
ncbi:hypothetical protein PC116_g31577 [Phytophthora cactorum]|nr:hypothetical protein PC116_g31577 [Phytophthora cactorum]